MVAQRERGRHRIRRGGAVPPVATGPDPERGVSGMKEPQIASFSEGLRGA